MNAQNKYWIFQSRSTVIILTNMIKQLIQINVHSPDLKKIIHDHDTVHYIDINTTLMLPGTLKSVYPPPPLPVASEDSN